MANGLGSSAGESTMRGRSSSRNGPVQVARVIGRGAGLGPASGRAGGMSASAVLDELRAGMPALRLGDERRGADPASGLASLPLADMLDRASAQALVLRRSLEEAAVVDRVVRQHLGDLHQRLEQTGRVQLDLDQRLSALSAGASVLEHASTALSALETLLGQLRATQEMLTASFEQAMRERLAEREAAMEQRLLDLEARVGRRSSEVLATIEQRLIALEPTTTALESRVTGRLDTFVKSFDVRLGLLEDQQLESLRALDERVRTAASGVDTIAEQCRSSVEIQAAGMLAEIDRRSAQVQARSSLVLDAVSDRTRILEQQAAFSSQQLAERVESLCSSARNLLGIEVRTGAASPAEGSLLSAIDEARSLLDRVRTATSGVDAMIDKADERIADLKSSIDIASTQSQTLESERQRTRLAIESGAQHLGMYQLALSEAGDLQARALLEMDEVRTRLTSMREDLATATSATQYHIDQINAAEAGAQETVAALSVGTAEARVKADGLQRAMIDVTAQAESLVALARDVAALMAKAQAQRDAMAA
jgi:chromosome segregation ATPase